jgi:hypothetical protein
MCSTKGHEEINVMLTTEVRRATVQCVEEKHSTLGYGRLLNFLHFMRGGKDHAALTPLQSVLKELEIEILNRQDVHRYQVEKAAERSMELLSKWADRMMRQGEFRSYDYFRGPSWETTPLRKFRGSVPQFVSHKAEQVSAAMPSCVMLVQYLEDHPDPFLIVASSADDDAERYYIEVWGEPEFERTLR